MLSGRIKDNGFSDERLKDAIANVIDNCIFPTPTIANILSFDKRITIYSYSDVLNELDNGKTFSDFTKVFKEGHKKPFYITKADQVKYNIPDNYKI